MLWIASRRARPTPAWTHLAQVLQQCHTHLGHQRRIRIAFVTHEGVRRPFAVLPLSHHLLRRYPLVKAAATTAVVTASDYRSAAIMGEDLLSEHSTKVHRCQSACDVQYAGFAQRNSEVGRPVPVLLDV
jgi:hypothetical protein